MGSFEHVPISITGSLTNSATAALLMWATTPHDNYDVLGSNTPFGSFTLAQGLGYQTSVTVPLSPMHFYKVGGVKNGRLGELSQAVGIFQFTLEPGS